MGKLCVDIGNTYIKAALFENERQVKFWRTDSPETVIADIESEEIELAIVSDVRKQGAPWLMQSFRNKIIFLDAQTSVPFHNRYSFPETLGADRIALVAGAQARMPHSNVLIIDAGTCITFDFLNKDGEYLGGAISPGMQMRFKSLNDYTAALPMVKWDGAKHVELIGNSTENSILSGIVLGIKHEVAQTIVSYAQQRANLKVLITGGDMHLFDELVKNDIFAVPNLLLEGLNQIAIHNESLFA